MERRYRRQRKFRRQKKSRFSALALASLVAATPLAAFAQDGYPLPSALGAAGAPQPQANTSASLLRTLHGGFHEFRSGNLSRIIGGAPAAHANWRSFVLVRAQTAPNAVATCGGAIIGRQWVLTAGHCVIGKSAASFTVVEGVDDSSAEGHKLYVDRILLHENYADGPPRNDIALLHLSSPATSPSQALLSLAASPVALRPGVVASLAGFGLTIAQPLSGAHTGSVSRLLREVDLPLVERSACTRILANVFGATPAQFSFINDSVVCAGDPAEGGRDACNGDSGGPLAIRLDNRRVQIGVVSWGPGCGLRDTVGVYTAVAYFEDWIRLRAPDAVFVRSSEEDSSAPQTSQATGGPRPEEQTPSRTEPCGLPPTPADLGVRVELVEGRRVRIGNSVHVRATPNVSGQLLLFNVDLQTCRTYQLFPNAFSGGAQVGSVVPAGSSAMIPAASDSFAIRVGAPSGRNRIYAMIVPAGVSIGDLASRGLDMKSFSGFNALWSALGARARSARGEAPNVEAVGTADYEIVQ